MEFRAFTSLSSENAMIASASRPAMDDDTIRDGVIAALRSSGHRVLERLNCEVRNGVVALSGGVPSFYLKQMAQSAVLAHMPLAVVNNMVEVIPGTVREYRSSE
jgi:osmotically-inducible protein OsmY